MSGNIRLQNLEKADVNNLKNMIALYNFNYWDFFQCVLIIACLTKNSFVWRGQYLPYLPSTREGKYMITKQRSFWIFVKHVINSLSHTLWGNLNLFVSSFYFQYSTELFGETNKLISREKIIAIENLSHV